ncbi:hypothetical protein [Carnobacterium funditum]|uniref:hypothetical protein n=1 Tax=Carnobacterium funditum TaxID=2752 RepID=UPI00146FBE6E|nr:hypothetical protein [Carnobacterium funditum]
MNFGKFLLPAFVSSKISTILSLYSAYFGLPIVNAAILLANKDWQPLDDFV